MNREIKFRGKTISGIWVYGNLLVLPKIVKNVEAGSYISNSAGMYFAYHVIPETVGQYIGINDKSGKGIYEGDVVHYDTENGIVRANVVFEISDEENMNASVFKFKFICNEDYINDDEGVDLEIIGNIHDNKDLLK